jgi:hypothetical protein
MKKEWSEAPWKARNRRRAVSSLARRVLHNKKIREARAPEPETSRPIDAARHRPPVRFDAPELLSLTDYPNQCISFFCELYSFSKRRDVFVDLSRVKKITPDAIALLVSVVIGIGRRHKLRIFGNYPDAQHVTEMIRVSGFDQYLKSSGLPSHNTHGAIVKKDFVLDSRRAEPKFAKQLIDFAAKDDGDITRLRPAYENLLECMGNTHQHASAVEGAESWWASVFQDSSRSCDCFTFVDMGVGIFDSIELGLRLKLYKLVGVGRQQIMRMLLAGKIPSSTGLGYRGKGLPSISDSMRDKHAVSRLVIITNDVYVDVGTDRFDLLPRHLKGLLLYWEVPYGNWRTNQNGQS